jgi:uncharacterized repeat protein (TIGR01451 family)
VTQAEIDNNGGGDGDIDNTATADSDQTGADTASASVPVARNPALNITKVVTDVDSGGASASVDEPGDVITYAITVANTGNTTLTGVTVTDTLDPTVTPVLAGAFNIGDTDQDNSLDVGETWSYSASYTATAADISGNGGGDGDIDNTATADSDQTGADTASASVPVLRRPPDIANLTVVHDETAGDDVDADDEAVDSALVSATESGLGLVPGSLSAIGQATKPLNITNTGSGLSSIVLTALGVNLNGNKTTDGIGLKVIEVSPTLFVVVTDDTNQRAILSLHLVDTSADGIPDEFTVVQYDSMFHADDTSVDEGLTSKITVGLTAAGPGGTDTAIVTVDVQDDAPTMADPANTIVFFVTSTGTPDNDGAAAEADGNDRVSFNFAPAQDDEGARLVFTDYTDPDDPADLAASGLGALEDILGDITAVLSPDGRTVTYYTSDGPDAGTDPDPLFRVTLDPNDPEHYDVEVLQQVPAAGVEQSDFFSFGSGSPVETITINTGLGTNVTFDGYLFAKALDGTMPAPFFNPGASSTSDDLNPNGLGFGVKGKRASDIDNNEGWKMTFTNDANGAKAVDGISFKIDQQGNTDDVTLAFQLTKNGAPNPTVLRVDGADGQAIDFGTATLGNGFYVYTTLPTGGSELIFTILDEDVADTYVKAPNEIVVVVSGEFDSVLFRATYPTAPGNYETFEDGSIRVADFALIQELQGAPDVELSFSAQGIDGDGDATASQQFTVGIDGDHDGLLTVL